MAKVSGPLFSFNAKGTYADSLVFRDYISGSGHPGRVNIKGFKKQSKGQQQTQKQQGISAVQKVWQSLNYGEKASWDNVAYGHEDHHGNRRWEADLAGYHKFMSYGMRDYLAGNEIRRTIVPVNIGFGKDRFGLDPFGHPI